MRVSPHISVEELVCLESFQQYCLGNNLADQLRWEEWQKENPARATDFEEAKRLFQVLNARQGNRLEQLKQLRTGIQQSETFQQLLTASGTEKKLSAAPLTAPFQRTYRYAMGMAAATVILLCVYFFLNQPFLSQTAQPITRQQAELPPQTVTIAAGSALRKTIVLADGSVITLRENSTLSYQPGFNQANREVWLSGEAFFDVKHSPAHPFVVHASFTDVKVLGTIFNVQAHPGATSTETSLLKGRVEVTSATFPGKSVILQPNQKLISSLAAANTQETSARPFRIVPLPTGTTAQPAKEIAWARTRLDIDDQPLSVIADRLGKWYGVHITFADQEAKEYRYSGVFENENVVRSLEALQLSYPFTFTVTQDTILISK